MEAVQPFFKFHIEVLRVGSDLARHGSFIFHIHVEAAVSLNTFSRDSRVLLRSVDTGWGVFVTSHELSV